MRTRPPRPAVAVAAVLPVALGSDAQAVGPDLTIEFNRKNLSTVLRVNSEGIKGIGSYGYEILNYVLGIMRLRIPTILSLLKTRLRT